MTSCPLAAYHVCSNHGLYDILYLSSCVISPLKYVMYHEFKNTLYSCKSRHETKKSTVVQYQMQMPHLYLSPQYRTHKKHTQPTSYTTAAPPRRTDTPRHRPSQQLQQLPQYVWGGKQTAIRLRMSAGGSGRRCRKPGG